MHDVARNEQLTIREGERDEAGLDALRVGHRP
jgi:hypothetical protein